MAVVSTPISCKASLTLNKGQDPDTGKTLTGTASINGLVANPDTTKTYGVAASYAECVAYPVVRVVLTQSSELEDE